jgi:hypothetical protein
MSLPAREPQQRRTITHDDGKVHRITTAQTGLSAEQRARTRRYLISMGIRTACFLGAVVASGWLRWALLAGAVILPYMAVVVANAGRENDDFAGPAPVTPVPLAALPMGDVVAGPPTHRAHRTPAPADAVRT